MTHDAKTETLNGQLQQLLFSPKGGIEGLLVMMGSKSIRISMKPAAADTEALTEAVGKPIEDPMEWFSNPANSSTRVLTE